MSDAREPRGRENARVVLAPVPPPAEATPSFDRIFADHAPLVWRALRRLGVGASDIEDACQEVFMIISRRLHTFQGRSAITTWIYGICVHIALRHRRRLSQRREEPMETVPELAAEAPELDQIDRRRAFAFADALLDAMDDDKRAVFVLFEIEEMTMKDVAEAVGCPLQTAYTRLYAARREFETALRRAKLQGRIG